MAVARFVRIIRISQKGLDANFASPAFADAESVATTAALAPRWVPASHPSLALFGGSSQPTGALEQEVECYRHHQDQPQRERVAEEPVQLTATGDRKARGYGRDHAL